MKKQKDTHTKYSHTYTQRTKHVTLTHTGHTQATLLFCVPFFVVVHSLSLTQSAVSCVPLHTFKRLRGFDGAISVVNKTTDKIEEQQDRVGTTQT
jgi:hypothetical protein